MRQRLQRTMPAGPSWMTGTSSCGSASGCTIAPSGSWNRARSDCAGARVRVRVRQPGRVGHALPCLAHEQGVRQGRDHNSAGSCTVLGGAQLHVTAAVLQRKLTRARAARRGGLCGAPHMRCSHINNERCCIAPKQRSAACPHRASYQPYPRPQLQVEQGTAGNRAAPAARGQGRVGSRAPAAQGQGRA